MAVLRKGDHGPAVTSLQKLLTKNGTNFRFYYGPIDGDFGPKTEHAVKRAKFRLGYAKASIRGIAGPQLRRYLAKPDGRPTAMKKRSAIRYKAEKDAAVPKRAWQYMVAHEGDHESPPGSNLCPATKEWGHGPMPWCNVLVSLAYIHAGSPHFSKSRQLYQYVPGMLADAQAGRNGLSITRSPQQGDLVVWNYPGGSLADHVTMFGHWTDSDHNWFVDEGGNEGASGVVKRDVNSTGYVQAYIRVAS